MRVLVNSIKLVIFVSMLFTFITHGFIAKIYFNNLWKLRAYMIPWMGRYSRFTLKLLGFHVEIKGQKSQNSFIVSNHLSYLDILILSSQIDASYVTSIEMKNAPVLGWVTQVAGCLYVERRNKDNLKNEIQDVADALNKGFKVIVFPEATSTNGEKVLPFKKPMFNAAIQTQKEISPLCIRYTQIDGKMFGPENHELICWYGDMDFLPHLWSVMNLRDVRIDLHYLSPISIDTGADVATLAQSSHTEIAKTYADYVHGTLSLK